MDRMDSTEYRMFSKVFNVFDSLILITCTLSNILSLFTKTGNLWTGWILQSIECFLFNVFDS